MRKNLFRILFVLLLLAVLPPVRTQAAGRDGFRLDESGTVTVVSGHAAQEGISSMSFSLSVESGAAAEFQFVENTAEIQEFRYDRDTRRLNIYLAGTEALFAEGTDSLTVGRIIVRDESGRETGAKVSVVDDSLQYVYGTELKTMGSLELPGTVQIGSGSAPDINPSPTEAPIPIMTPPAQTQTPEEPDEPDESEDDSAQIRPPVPVPARTPAPLAVKPPAQAQGGTSRPRATATPPARPQSTGSTSESTGSNSPASGSEPAPSVSSLPENTPEKEEDGYIFSGLPDEEDTEQTSGSKGVNVLLVVVVIVIIAVIAVEIVAFVVVKKKPKDK